MRKTILVILFIALLSVCVIGSALDEDFTLHSGVKCGMTEQEISSLEGNAGFKLKDVFVLSSTPMKKISGQVAGIQDSEIIYAFDSNGHMFASTYSLGGTYASFDPDYSVVEQALIEKYGEPDNSWFPAVVSVSSYEPFNYFISWGNFSAGLPEKYSSWLIKADDESYVVIVHYYAYGGASTSFHIIGYQQFSANEIDTIKQTVDEGVQQINQQLHDDI